MGYQLAGKASARWREHLNPIAFDVLHHMAMTARDRASDTVEAAMYFEARSVLLSVIRQPRGGKPEYREQSLKRALTELVARGAIKRTNRACAKRRQNYQLTLDGPIDIDWRRPSHKKKGVPQNLNGGTPGYPPRKEKVLNETKERTGGGVVAQRQQLTAAPPSVVNGTEICGDVDEDDPHWASELPGPTDEEVSMIYEVAPCGNPQCWLGYLPNPDRSRPGAPRNIPCPECRPAPEPARPPSRPRRTEVHAAFELRPRKGAAPSRANDCYHHPHRNDPDCPQCRIAQKAGGFD